MSEIEPVKALNLALPEQLSFIRCYRNLPERAPCTVRFFSHGDFYTVHEDNIQVAQEKANIVGQIKLMGEAPKLNYICLNKINFERFVRELLLVMQHRVEVYVKKSPTSWEIEYKGSPGNFTQFDDILFGDGVRDNYIVNTAIMAVKITKNKNLALACVNTTESSFFVNQFQDNDFFTELEAIITQISPKECVIPNGDTPELIKLHKVIDRNGVLVNKVNMSEFAHNNSAQDLNKLLYFGDGQKRDYLIFPDLSNDDTIDSLQAVISYLKLVSHATNHNQFKVISWDFQRFVRLDDAALTALNVLPQYSGAFNVENSPEKFHSIFGILDCCATLQGRRMLEKWLRMPLRDINKINERLEIVGALVNNPEIRTVLNKVNLTRFTDMMTLCRKLGSKKATLSDLYKVYQSVNNIEDLTLTLIQSENAIIKSVLIEPLKDLLNVMDMFQKLIEETIDTESADKDQFFVKPTYDEDLKDLFRQKKKFEENLQHCHSSVSNQLGFDQKQVKLEHVDHLGYIFRVTMKEEADLRSKKDIIIIDALKSGVRFRNSKLEEINNLYSEFKEQYEKKQLKIVNEILDVASGYADTIRNLNDFVAMIDVYVAMATVSADATIPFTRPKMLPMGSGILNMKKVRHPCLEKQSTISVIPNDIDLSTKNKDDGYTAVIITGPNMGGKSTYIRSIGMSVLLAHIGCFVPCETAEISIVDCILARIGAKDCESKGMSTFMLEMVETNSIIRSATTNSLAIIDELGRGTSTYDGYGIAASVFEHLATNVKCFTLFATHFHEITAIAEGPKAIGGVINRHVAAVITNDTITPLYQVCDGPSDKSYGLHCARVAEYPEDVLKVAREHQEKLELQEGYKYIKDFETEIKREIVKDGDKIIFDTVNDIKSRDVSQMTDVEIDKLFEDMEQQLMGSNNLFIKGLLEIGEN